MTAHGLFADRLREVRKRRGLTKKKLAERANVGKVEISRYESAVYRPTVDNLQALALALDVSADYLIDVVDTEPAKAVGPETTTLVERFKRLPLSEQEVVLAMVEGLASRCAS